MEAEQRQQANMADRRAWDVKGESPNRSAQDERGDPRTHVGLYGGPHSWADGARGQMGPEGQRASRPADRRGTAACRIRAWLATETDIASTRPAESGR